MPPIKPIIESPFLPINATHIVQKVQQCIALPRNTAVNLVQRALLSPPLVDLIVMAADNLYAKDQANLNEPSTPRDPSNAPS